jgi:hypothetical protein
MQRDQEDADYLAGAVFTESDAREMLNGAGSFLAEVERILKPAPVVACRTDEFAPVMPSVPDGGLREPFGAESGRSS